MKQAHTSVPGTVDLLLSLLCLYYNLLFCNRSHCFSSHVFQLWTFPEPWTLVSSFVKGPGLLTGTQLHTLQETTPHGAYKLLREKKSSLTRGICYWQQTIQNQKFGKENGYGVA